MKKITAFISLLTMTISVNIIAGLPTQVTDAAGTAVTVNANSSILIIFWNIVKGYLPLALWVIIALVIVSTAAMSFINYTKSNKEGLGPTIKIAIAGIIITIALLVLNLYLISIIA